MIGFFSKNKNIPPIDSEARDWMEKSFVWLVNGFKNVSFKNNKIFTPTPQDFPFVFNGSNEAGQRTALIISDTMNIHSTRYNLSYFETGIKEINTGTNVIFTQSDPNSKNAAGLYMEKDINGVFQIAVDKNLLNQPENLVATLAHEFSHIKLLGERRLISNDEYLTDLTTVLFGFGIFNANASFQFSQSFDSWKYSKIGYLSQMEWAYALALFAYYRNENNPDWIKYLNKSIKKDLNKSLAYININDETQNILKKIENTP